MKTLWHAALRDMGLVTVTVKSQRTKSKFSKPDAPKPDYVKLVIPIKQQDGSTLNEEFGYNTENEACANFFNGRVGQTIIIQAEGSREEAKITAVGVPGNQIQPPAPKPAPNHPPQQPPTQRTQAPAPHDTSRPAAEQAGDTLTNAKHFVARNRGARDPAAAPATRLTNAKHFVARNRVLAVIGLEAAWHTKREFEQAKQFEMPDAVFAALLNCMLFGASASGITATNQGIPLDLKFKVEAAK